MDGVGASGRFWLAAVGCFLLGIGGGNSAPATPRAATAGGYSVPLLRLPFMKKAPPIKGVVQPGEWAGADEMTGFSFNSRGGLLVPWAAHFWVGGDARDLFVAVVSQTPPGGRLLAQVNPNPAASNPGLAGKDDTVEILVAPSAGEGKGRIYQVLVNARGAVWQQELAGRGPAVAWRGHWRVASKVAGDRWDFQVAIPWHDFGIQRVAGKTVGIRIGRDWLQVPGGWTQSQWSPLGGSYTDLATMPLVTWSAAAPIVQVQRLQERPDGPPHIKLSVRNPRATPLRLIATIAVVPRCGKPATSHQTLSLAPHQERILQVGPLAVAGGRLYTQIQVSSARGKTVFYQRNFQWKIHRPRQLWAVNQGASRRIDTAFAYYPSYNLMQVRVNLSGLINRAKVRAVRLQVVDQRTHRIIAATTIAPRHGVARLHAWKLPPLQGALIRATGNRGGEWRKLPRDGRYHLVVRLVGVSAKPRAYTFVRYHFPWEHNKLGEANVVIPPFTPIQVHGKTVDVILRQYTMNGLGLWRQVQALGRNLLAGPMRLVVRADGKRFVGRGRLKFTRITPTRVVAVAQWSAGPLSGASRSVWDYDGMMKTFLTLEPTREKLDSVALVIPMANKRMPLMTACTDGLRFNYAGKTPAGQGTVWKGSQAPRNHIIGSYVPYIWTGGPERGVAVFGDNDRGWVDYQAKTPCQELVRKGDGTLELRLNLVAKPARLATVHRILLGFQATPIKPMPRNWRLWTAFGPPGGASVDVVGSCFYWGALTPFGDIYPRGQDFSIYRQFARTRRTGKIPWGFIKHWLAGYRAPVPRWASRWASQHGPSVTGLFCALARHPRTVILYTNSAAMRPDTRAGRTYLNEWDRKVYPKHEYSYGEYIDESVNPCRSFRDFAVWYYDKILTTFGDGIYWDNMFLRSDPNTVLTDAYRLPDGQVQPALPLWSQRALVRRTAVLDYELHRSNRNMVHMTNVAIAPVLAFARADLDLEMHYGESPFQDRFSRAFLLTESIGRQFGNVPFVLNGLDGQDRKELTWAGRTEAGVLLTFELRGQNLGPDMGAYSRGYARLVRFGYGRPGVRVWNYWRRGFPMKVGGDKTSPIIVGKPGRALIVVCDWGHGGVIRLKLNRRVLHLPSRLSATDMRTKQPLPVSRAGNVVAFPLKKYDFKMLLVK